MYILESINNPYFDDFDEFCEGHEVFVGGNRDYKSYTFGLEMTKMVNLFGDMIGSYCDYEINEVCKIYSEYCGGFIDSQKQALEKILEGSWDLDSRNADLKSIENFVDFVGLLFGNDKLEIIELCGSMQCEYQYAIVNVSDSKRFKEDLAASYFGYFEYYNAYYVDDDHTCDMTLPDGDIAVSSFRDTYEAIKEILEDDFIIVKN